jgi:hypothetical protein
MKQVLITYSDGSVTRHNAEGTSTAIIAKLVGDTICSVEQHYDQKTMKTSYIEVNLRIIKAEIF